MSETLNASFDRFIEGTRYGLEKGEIAPEKLETAKRLLELAESDSVISGGFAAFIAGASMHFSDELIGQIRAAVGDEDLTALTSGLNQFRQESDLPAISESDVAAVLERRSMQRYSDENPKMALGLEIAGAIGTGIVVPGGWTATIPRALGVAATSGAIAGAGAADENESRTSGAIKGAGLGAGGQGAVSLLGRGGQSLIRGLRTGTPQTSGRKIGEKVLREAMESDAVTPADVAGTIAGAGGKPVALADMGENLRGTLDAAKLLPGRAKKTVVDFVRERDKSMVTRLTEDLKTAFGKSARFFPEFKSMEATRKRLGGQLYTKANKKWLPVTNELRAIWSRPSVQDALSKADEIARESGKRMPKIVINDRGKLVDGDGNVINKISTQTMHFIKLAVDDVVFTGSAPVGGTGPVILGAVKQTRQKLLDYMDRNNPAYRRARDYWAGEMSASNAMKEGRKFLRADPDELDDAITHMGKSELEAFRLGAMQALIDGIEGGIDTANLARNMIKRTRHKKLIRSTFPKNEAGQKAFNKFIANLETEIDMKSTSGLVQGQSATEARRAAREKIEGSVATAADPPSGIVDAIRAVLGRNVQDVAEQQKEAAAQRLAEILTNTDPATLDKTLRAISSPGGAKRVMEALKHGPGALGRIISPVAVGATLGGQAERVPLQIDNLIPNFGP